nr:MAG TPA: hypothetical protein [Caudoviricetes sp.]
MTKRTVVSYTKAIKRTNKKTTRTETGGKTR